MSDYPLIDKVGVMVDLVNVVIIIDKKLYYMHYNKIIHKPETKILNYQDFKEWYSNKYSYDSFIELIRGKKPLLFAEFEEILKDYNENNKKLDSKSFIKKYMGVKYFDKQFEE